jgi:methylisocitrate lyase
MSEGSKARRLRELIQGGTVVAPGAFNAVSAMAAERIGFEAVYVSGAGLADGVAGFPDIGLLTLTEVVQQARYIADAVSVPAICDADTGFGEVLNVRRTVREFEAAGIAGIHIEDQESPKRCGHLSGKRLIPPEEMARKIAAAADARRDPDFLLIARVDSRSVNGLEDAIARAQLYLKAGADVIFPESLESAEEFARFAREVPAPLLANMTEFGRTPLLTVDEFAAMGYRLVIFPMTAFRVMMRAVIDALTELRRSGTQRDLLARMQTRRELYDLLRYADYERLDRAIAGWEAASPQHEARSTKHETEDRGRGPDS